MEDSIQILNETAENKDRQFVNALARGLEILRCFRPGEKYLANTELAKRTGMPKPTISRLTYTLIKLGYLGYSADRGQYHLRSAVLSLGNSLLSNIDVRKLARPAMRELAEHAQASVAIGIRDRLNMVYIETCRCSSGVTLRRDVGSHIPIATTAMGQALLSALPQTERDFLMDHIRLDSEEKWPQIKANLEQGFRDYQDHGFCISVGDWEGGINAVGVPLRAQEDEEVMAFNCGGPAYLLPRDVLMSDYGPRLVTLVHSVEVDMGRR